jgi:hypothetical protein
VGFCARKSFIGCSVAKFFLSSTSRAHVRPPVLQRRQFYIQGVRVDGCQDLTSELKNLGMRYKILEIDKRRQEDIAEVTKDVKY